MVYLPESLEFTGSGAERVIVILSDEPLQVALAGDPKDGSESCSSYLNPGPESCGNDLERCLESRAPLALRREVLAKARAEGFQ